jgi:hypothetical protein
MSENKTYLFETLIKNTKDVTPKHWRNNAYIRGRISGISLAICGGNLRPYRREKGGYVQVVVCEPEKYVEFKKLVDECYPGLCEFNYKSENCKEET